MAKITRFKSLFPNGYNLVEDDENLFLLHSHYYDELDKLFVLYKRYDNGETVLKIIDEPEVPVFIAKQTPKYYMEYIPFDLCDRVMVSYKNKEEEVKQELFDYRVVKYKDKKTGAKVVRKVFPNIPKKAEVLHPRLFYYDVPIEQIVQTEYAINRYKYQKNLLYEDVKLPHINYAAFDIETNQKNGVGEWMINTNTFVDGKTKEAYLDYVKDYDYFHRQQEMAEHKEEFIQFVKDTMENAITNSSLKDPGTREKVQKICRDFMKDLKIEVREFKDERELIMKTSENMFTTHKPDILMAYNACYDLGKFEERRKALNLPKGVMNERCKEFFDVLPPYAHPSNMKPNGEFRGDVVIPKKRKVYLNNISHTLIADLQTCHYSMRQGQVFASYALDALANRVLGFGKFDYSHVTNSITKLAHLDFWIHSAYALCDSIITLLISYVTRDFETKLTYCLRSKCNIEETAQSNSAITRSIHTDAYVYSNMIPGNNINRVLKNMTKQDVKDVSVALNINLMPYYHAVIYRQSFGGGK